MFYPNILLLKHLRGYAIWKIAFYQMPQTITNIPRCLPQILTVSKFWYHLAHLFSRKNVPF